MCARCRCCRGPAHDETALRDIRHNEVLMPLVRSMLLAWLLSCQLPTCPHWIALDSPVSVSPYSHIPRCISEYARPLVQTSHAPPTPALSPPPFCTLGHLWYVCLYVCLYVCKLNFCYSTRSNCKHHHCLD